MFSILKSCYSTGLSNEKCGLIRYFDSDCRGGMLPDTVVDKARE